MNVASAEDILIAKLEWFGAGDRALYQQWNDLRGTLAAQREKIDFAHLTEWARRLRVDDLLDALLAEPGTSVS